MVRQYNNLISLMDNWDDMETNLATARGSEGTLEKQSQIYQESWEAARDRVKAALQDIYATLVDSDAFKEILNVIEVLVKGLGNFIHAVGDLGGVLPIVGTLLLKTFGSGLADSINNAIYNLKLGTEAGRQEIIKLRQDAASISADSFKDGTMSGAAAADIYSSQAKLQEQLLQKTEQLAQQNREINEADKQHIQNLLDINAKLGDEYVELTKIAEVKQKANTTHRDEIETMLPGDRRSKGYQQSQQALQKIDTGVSNQAWQTEAKTQISNIQKAYSGNVNAGIAKIREVFKGLSVEINKSETASQELKDAFDNLSRVRTKGGIEKQLKIIQDKCRETSKEAHDAEAALKEMIQAEGYTEKGDVEVVDNYSKTKKDEVKAGIDQSKKGIQYEQNSQTVSEAIDDAPPQVYEIGDAFSSASQAAMSYGMAISQVSNFSENLVGLFTGQSDILQTLISGFMAAGTAINAFKDIQEASKIVQEALNNEENKATILAFKKQVVQKMQTLFKKQSAQASLEEAAALTAEAGAEGAAIAGSEAHTGAEIAEAAATKGLTLSLSTLAIGLMAVVAIYSLLKSAYDAHIQKENEEAQAARENISAIHEEVDANNELVNSYQEALKTYKQTGSGKEELNQKALEVAKSLGIEGAEALVLAGRYDELTQKINEANAAKLASAKADAEVEMKKAGDDLENAVDYNIRGHRFDDQHMGNASANQDALASLNDKGIDSSLVSGANTDWDDKDSILDTYKARQEYIAEYRAAMEKQYGAEAQEHLDNDAYFNALLDDQAKLKDLAEAYGATVDEFEGIKISDALTKATQMSGIDPSAITTKEEYQKYLEEMKKLLMEQEGLTAEAAQAKAIELFKNSDNQTLSNFANIGNGTGTVDTAAIQQATADYQAAAAGYNKEAREFEETYGKFFNGEEAQKSRLSQGADLAAWQEKLNAINAAKEGTDEYNQAVAEAAKYSEEHGMGLSKKDIEEGNVGTDSLAQQVNDLSQLVEGSTEYEAKLKEIQATADNAGLKWNKEDIEEAARSLDTLQEKLDGVNEKKGAVEELEASKEALSAAEFESFAAKIDEDLDVEKFKAVTEQIQDMAKESEALADSLEEDKKAAGKVAEEVMRYNDAIEDLNKSYDDWKDYLEDIADAGDDVIIDPEVITELRDAYGDLLDMDGEALSTDFLKSADNLDLFKQAVDGSEEAYDELMQKAQQDILAHCDLDTEQFDTAKTALDAELDNLNFEDIEIGADLNTDAALNAMTDLVNAAGMTADQATSYLASMGIDAEVVEQPVETKDNSVAMSLEPHPVHTTGTETLPGEGGGSTSYDFVGVEYTAEPVPYEVTKSETATSLRVTSANKSAGGGFKHSKGGGSRSSNGGRGGGGRRGRRGGRRGGSRRRETKELKKFEDEKERYYKINNELDNINKNLKKYETQADRSFGKSKLDLLEKTVQEYKKLQEATEMKLDEARGYQAQDIAEGAKYGWKVDPETGDISNYDTNEKRLLENLNNATTAYNNSSQDDKAKEALKKAEDQYKKAQDIKKKIEEDAKLIEDLQQEIRDYASKVIDARLEMAKYTVEVEVDVHGDNLNLLNNILDMMGDKADRAADAIGNLGSQANNVIGQFEATQQGIEDTLRVFTNKDTYGNTALSEDFIQNVMTNGLTDENLATVANLKSKDGVVGIPEGAAEQLRDLTQKSSEYAKTLVELRDKALERVADAFDEYNDKIKENTNHIKNLQEQTKTYKDIIDIVGKATLDATGKLSKNLSRANWELQRNNTHVLRSTLDLMESEMDAYYAKLQEAEEKYATTGEGEETVRKMREEFHKMEDAYEDTVNDFNDSWVAEMQSAADLYEETLDDIVRKFGDSVAGVKKSLDELQDDFDRKGDLDDIYVDDYEKIYELSKLTRDINKSIDDTDNLAGKEALRDLLKEINGLQEDGVQLSEYDIENARRRYELELARQALMQAQKAKNTVRMTRDAEGNYGYMYTADQEAVESAEQSYEDKLYEMQQANTEYIKTLQDNLISIEQDYANAISNMDRSLYATQEEFEKAAQVIADDYYKMFTDTTQQLKNALGNNAELYNKDWADYAEKTGYKISADEDYIDKFEETQLSLSTGFQTMAELQDAWATSVVDATNDAIAAWMQWEADTSTALADGGTAAREYGEAVGEVVAEVGEAGNDLENAAESMSTSFANAFDDIIVSLQGFIGKYETQIDKIVTKNIDVYNSINKVISAAKNLDSYTDMEGNTIKLNEEKSSSSSGRSSSSSSSRRSSRRRSRRRGRRNNNNNNGGSRTTTVNTKAIANSVVKSTTKAIKNITKSLTKSNKSKSSKNAQIIATRIKKYDTGGYTGDWSGGEGRLALLHSKELVLNKEDTSNILSAVETIRNISQTIDLNAASASSGLANLANAGSVTSPQGELQQNVSITAEFPNATDHNEIEEAFSNLINRASQFANRK